MESDSNAHDIETRLAGRFLSVCAVLFLYTTKDIFIGF